jgi:hypothetical protein
VSLCKLIIRQTANLTATELATEVNRKKFSKNTRAETAKVSTLFLLAFFALLSKSLRFSVSFQRLWQLL